MKHGVLKGVTISSIYWFNYYKIYNVKSLKHGRPGNEDWRRILPAGEKEEP